MEKRVNIIEIINMKNIEFLTLELTFFDILRSQFINLEENIVVLNKTPSKKKFYAFNAVFRVYVNNVKPFQKSTGRMPADHFHDPQPMPRIFKAKKTTVVDSNFAFFYHVSIVSYGG